MEHSQYKLQRQKLKAFIRFSGDNDAGSISGALDFWNTLNPLLDVFQRKDASMLFMSSEAVIIYDRLRELGILKEDVMPLDYSIRSIPSISVFVDLVKSDLVNLDTMQYRDETSILHRVLAQALKKYGHIGESIPVELLIRNLSLFFGVYLGECIISEIGEGMWGEPKNGQLSSLVFRMKPDGEYILNPVGMVYKGFHDNRKFATVEEIANHVFSEGLMANTILQIAAVRKLMGN